MSTRRTLTVCSLGRHKQKNTNKRIQTKEFFCLYLPSRCQRARTRARELQRRGSRAQRNERTRAEVSEEAVTRYDESAEKAQSQTHLSWTTNVFLHSTLSEAPARLPLCVAAGGSGGASLPSTPPSPSAAPLSTQRPLASIGASDQIRTVWSDDVVARHCPSGEMRHCSTKWPG